MEIVLQHLSLDMKYQKEDIKQGDQNMIAMVTLTRLLRNMIVTVSLLYMSRTMWMMEIQVPEAGDDVRHKDGISDGGDDRPKRSSKPNPKYNPDVYDLSYVGVRKRSRRSIRRADN